MMNLLELPIDLVERGWDVDLVADILLEATFVMEANQDQAERVWNALPIEQRRAWLDELGQGDKAEYSYELQSSEVKRYFGGMADYFGYCPFCNAVTPQYDLTGNPGLSSTTNQCVLCDEVWTDPTNTGMSDDDIDDLAGEVGDAFGEAEPRSTVNLTPEQIRKIKSMVGLGMRRPQDIATGAHADPEYVRLWMQHYGYLNPEPEVDDTPEIAGPDDAAAQSMAQDLLHDEPEEDPDAVARAQDHERRRRDPRLINRVRYGNFGQNIRQQYANSVKSAADTARRAVRYLAKKDPENAKYFRNLIKFGVGYPALGVLGGLTHARSRVGIDEL